MNASNSPYRRQVGSLGRPPIILHVSNRRPIGRFFKRWKVIDGARESWVEKSEQQAILIIRKTILTIGTLISCLYRYPSLVKRLPEDFVSKRVVHLCTKRDTPVPTNR
jgi:hypothetical protein